MKKDNATNNAKIKNNALEWYVPQNTPSLEEYKRLMEQVTKKTPTQLLHPERSVSMTEVITQKFWTFELGVQEINFPIWIYVVFQQSDRQHDQNLNNDNFYRIPVTSAQVVTGTERYPDNSVLLNYNDDDYSQGCGQIKEVFKSLTKDIKLQPYITEDIFRSSNDADIIGYNIHCFDIRYQKKFESGQSVKVEFKLDGVVPVGIYGYALVLPNGLVSISSDEQRMFDLT